MNDKIKAIEERHERENEYGSGIESYQYSWEHAHLNRGTLIEEYRLLEGRLEAAELDLLEVNADLSAERRVSYTFKESLDEAEATIKSICRVVDRMVNEGVQNDDGVRLREILLKAILYRSKS